MAALDHFPARSTSLLARMGAAFERTLTSYIEARGRTQELERLSALSDAQLAAKGLRRDQIVAHVFRDQMLLV